MDGSSAFVWLDDSDAVDGVAGAALSCSPAETAGDISWEVTSADVASADWAVEIPLILAVESEGLGVDDGIGDSQSYFLS